MAVSALLQRVLDSAARLQELVPEAVLVGGSAAALYAGHRDSLHHDHVLTDLVDRHAEVVEAVEASDGWVTSVRASSPPLEVAAEVRALITSSGLTVAELASRVGTSRTRLSTCRSGRVVPSATMMSRLRRTVSRLEAGRVRD